MISYFPEIYPDELLYSLLARYYTKSGYTSCIAALQDLYAKPITNPSIEFINPLTDEAYDLLTRHKSIEMIVEKHTMFPYYSRFLAQERRHIMFNSLVLMDSAHLRIHNVSAKKDNTIRYLRYCPICTINDRKQYGETYWHREHQLWGVRLCPKHKCYLANSEVKINKSNSPILSSAEG